MTPRQREIYERIRRSRPEGHFAGVEKLLLAYVAKLVEAENARIAACEIADPVERVKALAESAETLHEAVDLCVALRLRPGDTAADKPLLPQ